MTETQHVVIVFSRDHDEQGRVREVTAADAKALKRTGRARAATDDEIAHGVAVDHPEYPGNTATTNDEVAERTADVDEISTGTAPATGDQPSAQGVDDPPATIDQGGNAGDVGGPSPTAPAVDTTVDSSGTATPNTAATPAPSTAPSTAKPARSTSTKSAGSTSTGKASPGTS